MPVEPETIIETTPEAELENLNAVATPEAGEPVVDQGTETPVVEPSPDSHPDDENEKIRLEGLIKNRNDLLAERRAERERREIAERENTRLKAELAEAKSGTKPAISGPDAEVETLEGKLDELVERYRTDDAYDSRQYEADKLKVERAIRVAKDKARIVDPKKIESETERVATQIIAAREIESQRQRMVAETEDKIASLAEANPELMYLGPDFQEVLQDPSHKLYPQAKRTLELAETVGLLMQKNPAVSIEKAFALICDKPLKKGAKEPDKKLTAEQEQRLAAHKRETIVAARAQPAGEGKDPNTLSLDAALAAARDELVATG
jgi:hypothetical protein